MLCLKDGLHDRGIGQRLPNRSARIGNAHEDRACAVEHQQGGGLRQMRPADKLGQPAKIQRPEEHVRPRAGTPSDRLREDDTALSGDPPDLVIADDERKPLPRRAKPGAVSRRDVAGRGHGTADHGAIRSRDTELDVPRVDSLKVLEELFAGAACLQKDRDARQRSEELAPVVDDAAVFAADHPCQAQRVLAGGCDARRSFLRRVVEDEDKERCKWQRAPGPGACCRVSAAQCLLCKRQERRDHLLILRKAVSEAQFSERHSTRRVARDESG